ncbi:hypothetical protein HAX54_022924 [Datura stramonium]|uniref:Uncharacterized protein n=1 Tax=Datura stramonium TaxID=4076 RepID=A0ABS8UV76_DATST|nr:hypothetical protein [Datura stramonium]
MTIKAYRNPKADKPIEQLHRPTTSQTKLELTQQPGPPAQENKSWVNLFIGNIFASKDTNMQFIALVIKDGDVEDDPVNGWQVNGKTTIKSLTIDDQCSQCMVDTANDSLL